MAAEHEDSDLQPPPSPRKRLLMVALWPAFAMAGVLEALLFALVSPADLTAAAGSALPMSDLAVYTLAFMAFWAIISIAAGVAVLLAVTPPFGESAQ